MKSTLIATLLLALAACGSVTSPQNHYYTLSSSAAAANENADVKPAQGQDWKLRGVTIPDLLDRPQIVIKTGANGVDILEYQRWAEPLDSMIFRVLIEDLNALDMTRGSEPEREISVAIDEFDADPSGHIVLAASWKVKTGQTTSRYVFRQSAQYNGGNISAMVSSMSGLLGSLAQNIARQR